MAEQKEKQMMPQSGAGLMRYDEGSERVKIKPTAVVVISVIFAGIILILKFFG